MKDMFCELNDEELMETEGGIVPVAYLGFLVMTAAVRYAGMKVGEALAED